MLAFEADFVISFLLDWLFWEIFFVRFFPLPLPDFFESFDNSITNSATEINYVFIHRTVGNSENLEGQVEIQGILKGEGLAFIPVKKLACHVTPHYGSTGCWVFKQGIQNWKDFCLKINIPKRKLLNYENWVNGEVSKVLNFDFQSQFSMGVKNLRNLPQFFFHWRISI